MAEVPKIIKSNCTENKITINSVSVPKQEEKTVKSEELKSEENIFIDYLKDNNLKEEPDFANEIARLKLSNDKNVLKIAKVIITYREKYKLDNWEDMYKHLLNSENVKIKKTQADKYIAVYDYCYKKYQKTQTTENMLNLGIEKLYLISTLEDKEKQEKLENFISEKKKSVKELEKLVKLLNRNSDMYKILDEFNKYCEN